MRCVPTPAAVVAGAAVLALSSAACGSKPADAQKDGVEAVYSRSTGKLELLKYDSNKDGKPDTWSYMEGTRIVRIEVDRDFDDVVDRWEYYTADGRLEKVGMARQNDGVVDAWAFQGPDGNIARVEVSTKRDGQVNRWERMAGGVLVSAEEDGNGDGRPDRWETYENGALATVSIDTQGRGRPDRKLTYGPGGVRVEKLE